MTLANQNSTVTATGNGVTTEWPYTFKIPTDADLNVGLFTIATGVLVKLNPSVYSVTGLGTDAGGEVTYPLVGSPITSATRLVIWREVAYTQDIDLTNQSPYYSETLEDQLDKMVMQVQQLSEETSRAFKVTLGSNSTPDELVELLTGSAVIAVAAAGTATTQAGNAATSASTATTEAADAAQSATDAENYAIAIAQAAVMVGSTMEWNGPVPAGWLRFREGGTFNRATFPDLATFWDANGSFWGMTAPEIAAGQFPDTRDYVSRHAGGSLGPAVGAKQADAFQGHFHQINGGNDVGGGGSPTRHFDDTIALSTQFLRTVRNAVTDGVNGTPRTASETRVKSFGVRYIIKAASAATNQGLVDMLALATQAADNTNRIAVLEAIGKPFTKEYVSAEQVITGGGLLTLTHSLGVAPKLGSVQLVCKTAEHGYVPGQSIEMGATGRMYGTESNGFTFASDATSISVKQGSTGSGQLVIPVGGSIAYITAANWRLIVRAWA